MEPLMLFVLVLLLLVLGLPIAVALGLSSVLFLLLFSTDSLASIALKLFQAQQHYTLLAIPYFILSSAFLSTGGVAQRIIRSEEHTSELQSLMRISYAVFCLKKNKAKTQHTNIAMLTTIQSIQSILTLSYYHTHSLLKHLHISYFFISI